MDLSITILSLTTKSRWDIVYDFLSNQWLFITGGRGRVEREGEGCGTINFTWSPFYTLFATTDHTSIPPETMWSPQNLPSPLPPPHAFSFFAWITWISGSLDDSLFSPGLKQFCVHHFLWYDWCGQNQNKLMSKLSFFRALSSELDPEGHNY